MKKLFALLLILSLLLCGCAGGEGAGGRGKILRSEEPFGESTLARTYRFNKSGVLTGGEAVLRFPDEGSAERAAEIYRASPELYGKVTLAGVTLSLVYTEQGLGTLAGIDYDTLRLALREAGTLVE